MVGTLADFEIIEKCQKGELITEGFEKKMVKQSCYELRSSTTYYEITDDKKKVPIEDNEYILLKPKQQVVIITKEKLNMPSDMLGRILTKGKLFSIGILPVNTYADPGFQGTLGIILYNTSNKYIKIKPNTAIAKIEFTKLENANKSPYSGQHGYETEIWPIPEDMYLTDAEMKKDFRIGTEIKELSLSHGKPLARIYKSLKTYRNLLIALSSTYLVIIIVVLLNTSSNSQTSSFAINIGAGLVTSVITMFLSYFFGRKTL